MAEILTGEAVVLELRMAQFPTRMAALLLDLVVQVIALVIGLVAAASAGNAAWAAAIGVTTYVLVVIAYPTTFETASRGKSLGKLAFGLRVVSDDGSPERFRQALIRALSGMVEIWSPFMAAGLITAMLNARGKRLGDLFAGTFVIQERAPRQPFLAGSFATVPPPLAAWAASAEISRLSDRNADAAGSYLRRYYQLRPEFRDTLGQELAGAVASQVSPPPPPGTPPAAFLAAVLAVRRDREYARLASQQAARSGWTGAPAGTAGPWAGQAGTWPGQPGTWPGQPGTWPGQNGTLPGQPGTLPVKAEPWPDQPGTSPGPAWRGPASAGPRGVSGPDDEIPPTPGQPGQDDQAGTESGQARPGSPAPSAAGDWHPPG